MKTKNNNIPQVFDFNGCEIRTVKDDNNQVWFVANDIARGLEYTNPRDALSNHVDNEDRADVAIHYGSQNRKVNIINESGMYSLVLSSKKKEAKKFKRWVTSEVLPQINKTGSFLPEDQRKMFDKAMTENNDLRNQLARITDKTKITHAPDEIQNILRNISIALEGFAVQTMSIGDMGDKAQRCKSYRATKANLQAILMQVDMIHKMEALSSQYNHDQVEILSSVLNSINRPN